MNRHRPLPHRIGHLGIDHVQYAMDRFVAFDAEDLLGFGIPTNCEMAVATGAKTISAGKSR